MKKINFNSILLIISVISIIASAITCNPIFWIFGLLSFGFLTIKIIATDNNNK